MSKWPMVPLREVCNLNYGKGLPSEDRYDSGDIPVYGANGIKGLSDRWLFDGSSIVVGRKGTAGALCKVDGKFWPLDVTYFVTVDESNVNRDYLYFALGQLDLPSLARGVKPGINREDVYNLLIPLPPLDEQKRIVAKLDEVQSMREDMAMNQSQRMQLIHELYLRLRSRHMFENTLAWTNSTLGEVCTYRNGKAHEPFVDPEGQYRLVTSKFVSTQGAKARRVTRALTPLTTGDVAIVLSDLPNGKTLGKAYLVGEEEDLVLNQRVMALRSDRILPEFLFHALDRSAHFLAFDNGESQTHLKLAQVLACPISFPALEEQAAVAALLSDVKAEQAKMLNAMSKKAEEISDLFESVFGQVLGTA